MIKSQNGVSWCPKHVHAGSTQTYIIFSHHRLPAQSFRIPMQLSFIHIYLILETKLSSSAAWFHFSFSQQDDAGPLGPFSFLVTFQVRKLDIPLIPIEPALPLTSFFFLSVFPAQNSIWGICNQRLAL